MRIITAYSLKKTLALALTMVLIVLMLPFSAFAYTTSITGTVTNVDHVEGEASFMVVPDGSSSSQLFATPDGVYLDVGDTVKVYFDTDDSLHPTKVTVLNVGNPPPPVKHKYYSATGVITSQGMSTISIMCQGTARAFSKENGPEIIGTSTGFQEGDTVKIVYDVDDPKYAVQIIMIAHGENHNNRPADTISHYSVTGQIVDCTMNTITVYTKGSYRTFGKEDAAVNADDGLLLGDTVKIVYHQDDPQTAVSITMIREGDNH